MSMTILAAMLLTASQTTPAAASWRACVNRTATNFEWGRCGATYIHQAEEGLKAKWHRLMAATDGQTKADLIAEQQAWTSYRQVACRFYGNGDNGREGEVLDGPGCVAALIERRTADLDGYLNFFDQK